MRKLFAVIGLSLLVIILLMIYRTLTFSHKHINPYPLISHTYKFDEVTALNEYSQSLTYQTISSELTKNTNQFEQFRVFLQTNYSEVFNKLLVKRVGEHGLLLKWEGRDKNLQPVLFIAHQDVVPIPPENVKYWTYPPFSGKIAAGFVWGRGALDCKASLNALLFSTSELLKKNFVPNHTVYFYLGDDEENGGNTAKLASGYLKSQGIHFETIMDEGGLIAVGFFPGISSPVALIGIAEKGWLDLELTAQTPGGHASIPPKILAIGEMSKAIDNLLANPFPLRLTSVTRHLFETLALRKDTFFDKFVMANIWLFNPIIKSQISKTSTGEALLHTTQAPTIFRSGSKSNVLPTFAEAVINFRIDQGDSVNSVVDRVRNNINDSSIKIKKLIAREPSSISSESLPQYQLLSSSINLIYGKDVIVAPYIVVGGTDSRQFSAITTSIYRFSPLQVTHNTLLQFHGPNERFAAKNYFNMIKFYYTVLENE